MKRYFHAVSLLVFVPFIAFAAGVELLPAPWHLVGNNGAAEKYQSVPQSVLQGAHDLTVQYDLHGLCVLGGDASGLIFDQNGWKLASLLNYGQNCFNGVQTVTIPLTGFGVDVTQPLSFNSMFHARFWHEGAWNVDILSAVLDAAAPPLSPPQTPVVPQHIVMVVEESRTYEEIIGNADASYINSLAKEYALAKNFYGETHPSIGNYFQLTTGNIITNDNEFDAGPLYIDNIARQLNAGGKTWKVYAQSLPSVGYTGFNTGPYVKRHNPFAYLSDVVLTSQKNNIVPFSQFAIDLANDALPNFAFVVPDNNNNMHDGTVAEADVWLLNNIKPVFDNAVFKRDGLLILTWDEGDIDNTNGGGHIGTIFAGQNAKNGYQSTALYHHQSLLKLIVKNLGLPGYPGDSLTAPAMDEFFKI